MQDRKKYLDTARFLAYNICRTALWHEDRCNWITASSEDYYGRPRTYAFAMRPYFYDGLAGTAFFLTAMCSVDPETILHHTAKAALKQMVTLIEAEEGEELQYGKLGFHTGYPGVIYTLLYAAEVFGEESYKVQAKEMVRRLAALDKSCWRLDIIDGAAGAVPALICSYKALQEETLLRLLKDIGEFIITQANKEPVGVSWPTLEGVQQNLTGFAHGAAGIVTALLELYLLTDDERYKKLAAEGVAYENSHFVRQEQNWPDFRSTDLSRLRPMQEPPAHTCSNAWCHGAPGIGLSRVRAWAITGEQQYLNDALVAIRTTSDKNNLMYQGNFSMCHGILGNAELLMYGGQVLQDSQLLLKAYEAGDLMINDFVNRHKPIPNGLHNMVETPDFMLGNAGAGYYMLRLYDPVRFPSVLLIDPEIPAERKTQAAPIAANEGSEVVAERSV